MAGENNNILITPEYNDKTNVSSLVYKIRGYQIMLDTDLADLYGYEVKYLNRQVKRNSNRFPSDFVFQLTREELDVLRCQNGTANVNAKSRILPYAFTEQGVYMLASVLRGELADQQSIAIMRAFREMRHYIHQNQQFVTRDELKLLTNTMELYVCKLDKRQDEAVARIEMIQNSINSINENFVSDTELKCYIIYKGQKIEADKAYIDIFRAAKKTIYVVDNYVNIKTLHLLSHKRPCVSVVLFTENGFGNSKDFLTASEIADFNREYPSIQIKPNPDCHDRFIILDYGSKNEKVFHCGASSKDSGNKVCAINTIENTELIKPIINALLINPDKVL